MRKTVLIYHGDCPDGFMAAVIFGKAAGRDIGQVEFHAGVHQESPPDIAGKEVVLVDFSYRRPVILAMAKTATSILIVDHHVSAQEDLVNLPANVKTIFDMDQSGAGLAWRVFIKKEPAPKIVLYVEAMDLWRLDAYPDVGRVMAGLCSHDYDFKLWNDFLEADQDELIADLAREGASIERGRSKDVRELLAAGRHELEIAGKKVPAINAPRSMASQAANILAVGQPFAASYCISNGYVNFSLRSEGRGEDVARIAFGYGGGGHRHAAGFKIRYTGSEIARALKLKENTNSAKPAEGL